MKIDLTYETLRSLDSEEQLAVLCNEMKKANRLSQESGPEQIRGPVEVFKTNSRIKYAPTSRTNAGIALFKASESYSGAAKELSRLQQHPNLGWTRYAAGPLECHEVPGNHITMLRKPHVDELAKELGECINKVDG